MSGVLLGNGDRAANNIDIVPPLMVFWSHGKDRH